MCAQYKAKYENMNALRRKIIIVRVEIARKKAEQAESSSKSKMGENK